MGLQSYSNIENGDSLLFDFPRDTMNLGTVNEGEIVPFSFTVKNNYETIVYVSQVYPSCGCTKAEIDTFYLYPQESKKLNFNFDSNGRPGMNYRIIRVFTEKGLFDVRFKVNVIPKE
ncbi:MAG: DUF1573 domain-containing protein [Bacteroidetes bacterium]|nr:DUF1573 domain-containing protein [Bacteroidota bacterium]